MAKILKHRWQRRLLIALAITTGTILILALLANLYWSPILAKKVRSAVLTSSDSLYTVDFTNADLHILRGEIDIYNITLKPDTAVYNRRKQNHLAPNNLVELHVKRLILSHIHPLGLYFHHRLNIGQVILNQPEIKVSYQLNHTKDTTINDRRTLWQKMSKTLRSIHIGQISLSDVQLKYEDYSGNKLEISELKEMSLNATDLLIDSSTQNDKSRLLYCKDIDAELNNYVGHSSNGLYSYKIKSLRLSTQTSKLKIQGLDLQPVKTEKFIAKTKSDRFDAHLDSLEIDNFDYVTFHKYRTINASHVKLKRGSLNLFKNPNRTPSPPDENKEKTFPNFGLKEIKADLNIDTIDLSHITVIYTEVGRKSAKAGTITFNNTSGRILNVTTNKAALQKNNLCTVALTSYFMNQGKLNVLFTFNLTDENLPFSYKGDVGPMNLHVLNPAIMPLGLVKINTGRLNRFTFDVHANNKVAKGRITMLYDSLKVTVLKPDTANDRLRHMTIASLFANILVLKHNNPDKPGETPRSFYVTFNRPTNYPFFKTIWHTLLTGIKPSIGLDVKMQSIVRDQITHQSIKKQERAIKKAARIQRRADRKHKRELKKEQKEQEAQQKAEGGTQP